MTSTEMTRSHPQVSIILPLSSGPVQTLRCLEGLARQDGPSFEVIVVDDCSVGLETLLQRLDGDVEVVRSEHRLGFAGAVGLGAEWARGDFALIIRGAAAPTDGWLTGLVDALQDPTTGVATSVSTDDPEAVPSAAWAAGVRTEDLSLLAGLRADDRDVIPTLALELAHRGRRTCRVPASRIEAPGTRTGAARRAPGETPELTIVIPTLDATSERVVGCLRAIAAATTVAHVIVLVDNGSPPQGFTDPVNAGIRAARTPYVVVMNDDVEPLPGWWEPLRSTLDAGASVAFPLTVDGAMRTDFAAWCFAMTQATITEFGHDDGEFFDRSLVIWFQDTDLLVALQRAGHPPVLVREARIRHALSQTVATEDPELSAWVRQQIVVDEQRFRAKHADPAGRAAALASVR